MLKLSICILLFLGTQTYFLPPWLGQLSSSDSDLIKKIQDVDKKYKMLIQAVHEKLLYKKYYYQGFVRDLKSQGTSEDKRDGGNGKMILDDGFGNIRLL